MYRSNTKYNLLGSQILTWGRIFVLGTLLSVFTITNFDLFQANEDGLIEMVDQSETLEFEDAVDFEVLDFELKCLDNAGVWIKQLIYRPPLCLMHQFTIKPCSPPPDWA